MMSSSFFQGGRNLTLSSEGTPLQASQSGHGGSRDSNTSASHRDQGGEGGTDFHDKQVAVAGSSSKIHAARQVNSATLKTDSHTKALISREPVSCRKICNGSYTSGYLKKSEALITVRDGTSSQGGLCWKIYKDLNRKLYNFRRWCGNIFS